MKQIIKFCKKFRQNSSDELDDLVLDAVLNGLDMSTHANAMANLFNIELNTENAKTVLNVFINLVWSTGLDVFKINRDVADELGKEFKGVIPIELIRNTPYPVQYIEINTNGIDGLMLAWVSDKMFFKIEVYVAGGTSYGLSIPSHFGDITIEELAEKLMKAKGITDTTYTDNMKKVLPYIVYAASQWHNVPKSQVKSHIQSGRKSNNKVIYAKKPRVHHIGGELGERIRKSKAVTRAGHMRVGHLRRGHLHGYWHGTGDDRKYKVKWVNPTFVKPTVVKRSSCN